MPTESPLSRARRLGKKTYIGRPCKRCGSSKRLTCNADCVVCARNRTTKWKHDNPDRLWHRRHPQKAEALAFKHTLKLYNLSRQDFDRMLIEQSGRCLTCSRPLLAGPQFHDHDQQLCIDHDHQTGRVRGLLCRRCNLNDTLEPLPPPVVVLRTRRRPLKYLDFPILATSASSSSRSSDDFQTRT